MILFVFYPCTLFCWPWASFCVLRSLSWVNAPKAQLFQLLAGFCRPKSRSWNKQTASTKGLKDRGYVCTKSQMLAWTLEELLQSSVGCFSEEHYIIYISFTQKLIQETASPAFEKAGFYQQPQKAAFLKTTTQTNRPYIISKTSLKLHLLFSHIGSILNISPS